MKPQAQYIKSRRHLRSHRSPANLLGVALAHSLWWLTIGFIIYVFMGV